MTDAERRNESAVMHWAFLHVYHQDHANAAMHTAPVRYSPVTFRLAECLRAEARILDLAEDGWALTQLGDVLEHLGTYEEDKGR